MLGPIEVGNDGEMSRLRGQQAMLVAHLVAAYPEPISFGALESAFWGENPPAQADNAMRVAVTRLRNKLGSDTIEFSSAGYRLTLGPSAIDSVGFEQGVAAATEQFEAGDIDGAYGDIMSTLQTWRGDPFATVADGFTLEPAIRKLSELHSHAEDLEVELLLAAGKFAQAAVRASETTTSGPLRERRWEHLMLALYQSGRATEALRVFQQYRSFLADEVGLEPGTTIRVLEQSIAQGREPEGIAVLPEPNGEPTEGPDLRTGGLAPRAPVPAAASSFVHREEVASAIHEALGIARLVTVVGPPGVGKTRLAREYARSLDDDEVWWIDLAVETAAGAVSSFSERFGVVSSDDPIAAAKAVADRLGDNPVVVVVDNCEHVIHEVGPMLEAIVEFASESRVLATSRQPLATDNERVVRVGPMSSDEALRLLRQRTDPSRSVPSALAERIVAGVDNVPLAIEVIATRLRTHTPAEVLSTGLSTEHELHRFGASFDSMFEADRRLFAGLGVMAGAFDVDAAAHVFDASSIDTRAGLDRLVEASVVELSTAGAVPRYRLLQPMKDLALGQLGSAGDLVQMQGRHVAHFAAITVERSQALMDDREERAKVALEADASQVREAWRVSLDTGDVDRSSMLASSWWIPTLHSLRHRDYPWPQQARSVDTFDDSQWQVAVLGAAAMSESMRGRITSAIDAGEQAIKLATSQGARPPREARFGLISAYGFRGRYDEAHQQLISLISEAQDQGDMYTKSGGLSQVAFAFALLGMTDEAQKQAAAALDAAEASINTSTLAFAHHAMALTLVEQDAQAALRYVYESIRLSNRSRNTWLTGWATSTLAGIYRRVERYDEAAMQLGELITHWRAVEMEPQLVHTVLESALLFDQLGDDEGVLQALTIANEGRTRHPFMPTDEARVEALYRSATTPAPPSDESDLLDSLRERLGAING